MLSADIICLPACLRDRLSTLPFPHGYKTHPQQVPLITMTELLRKRLKADTLGNCVFWASFCVLGQPMCLVL